MGERRPVLRLAGQHVQRRLHAGQPRRRQPQDLHRDELAHAPYYADCRWKTQNVSVHDNAFSLDAAHVPACKLGNGCGFNAIFSNWGTFPSWSPYKGAVIENAISFHQNNVFSHNAYTGTWGFMLQDQSGILNLLKWQAAPALQDLGSTMKP